MKKTHILISSVASVILLIGTSCTQKPVATQATAANSYGVPQTTTAAGATATYPTTASTVFPASTSTVYPSAAPTTYPAATASVAPASFGQSYTIQKGDTLWGISREFNTSVGALQSANGISGSTIIAGQTITIP